MVKILRISKKWLGEILVDEGLLTQDQVNEALETQKKTGELLGQILVRFEWVTERDIAKTVAKQLSLPFLPASSYFISDDACALIPYEVLQRLQVVPIDCFGAILVILAAGAINNGQLEELEQVTGKTLRVFVGTATDVKTVLTRIGEMQGKVAPEGGNGAAKPKKPAVAPKPAAKKAKAAGEKSAAAGPEVEVSEGQVDSDTDLGYAAAGVPGAAEENAASSEEFSAVLQFLDQCDKNVKDEMEKSNFEYQPEKDEDEDEPESGAPSPAKLPKAPKGGTTLAPGSDDETPGKIPPKKKG